MNNITSYEICQLLDKKIAKYYLENNNGDLSLQYLIERCVELEKELDIVEIYTEHILNLITEEINDLRKQ